MYKLPVLWFVKDTLFIPQLIRKLSTLQHPMTANGSGKGCIPDQGGGRLLFEWIYHTDLKIKIKYHSVYGASQIGVI